MPEKTPLPQKVFISPTSQEHSSWITFASFLRNLKKTLVAAGSSSAVLPSTSQELIAHILVMWTPLFLGMRINLFKFS